MKTLLATLLFFFYCHISIAQNPLVKQWDKRFGGTMDDWVQSFRQTPDGGYILGGTSSSPAGGDKTDANLDTWGDYWIVKIDSLGAKQWDKRYGGIYEDYFYALQPSSNGGYMLAGSSHSDSTGDKTTHTKGSYDYWLIKIDGAGNKLWDKSYGGAGEDQCTSMDKTADGGYILAGRSNSGISGDRTQANWDTNSYASFDYWIVKVDSAGNKLWDKRFGGIMNDELNCIRQTADHGYIMGGFSATTDANGDKSQPNWGWENYWVVKTDSLGNKQWDKVFGGTNNYGDVLNALQQTTDGGYILGGTSRSGVSGNRTQPLHANGDYWIVKIDAFGNIEWDKSYGGLTGGSGEDEFTNLFQTAEGGFLLSGTSYCNASGDKTENNLGQEQTWLVKIDCHGNKQWDKTILTTGHDEAGITIPTSDGGYAIGAYTGGGIGGYKSQSSRGHWDYWVIKFRDTSATFVPLQANISAVNPNCPGACSGGATVSAQNSSSPYHYLWFPGNATTSAISNLCAGTYRVTVTDSTGCSQLTDSVIITAPVPVPVIISASATTICANDSSMVCAPSGYDTYHWNVGPTDSCITTQLAGNYYVTVTDNTGCTAESNHLAITVHTLPPVAISVNGDTLSVYGAVTQQWYLNGAAISGATNNTYITTLGGSYTVQVTDTNGCTATSNSLVISGVDNITEVNGVSVYPNPLSTGNWHLTAGSYFSGGTVEILDADGRTIFHSPITTQQLLITPDVSRGIYLLRVSSSKYSVVRKLIRL